MRLKLAAFLFAAALSAALAAELPSEQPAAARLPDSVLMVASVSSPMRLLESLDGFLANALEGTPTGYQAGLLPILSLMFLPPPLAEADLDGEAHALFLADGDSLFERIVFLAGVGEYRHFLNAAARGGEAAEDDDGIALIESSDGPDFHIADAGGGKAIIAMSRRDAVEGLRAVESWRPDGNTGGALELTLSSLAKLDRFDNIGDMLKELGDKYEELGEDAAEKLHNENLNGAVLKSAGRALKQAFILANQGLDGLAGGKVEIIPDDHNLLVRLFMTPGVDGLVRDVAKNAAGLENTIAPATRAVAATALGMGQTAPLSAVLPGHRNYLDRMVTAVFRESMPEVADDIMRNCDRFFAAGVKEDVKILLDLNSSIEYIRADDPKAVFDVITAGFQTCDAIFENAFEKEAAKRMRFAVLDESIGGTPIRRFRMVFDEGSLWDRLRSRLDDEARLLMQTMENLHLLATYTDEYVVVLTSNEPEADALLKAVADLAGAAAPMLDTPQAQKVLDAMRYRQVGYSLISPAGLVRMGIESVIATQKISAAGVEVLQGVLEDVIPSDELFGFGLGAGKEGLAYEAMLTAAGTNNLIKNYFLIIEREEALYGSGARDGNDFGDEEEEDAPGMDAGAGDEE